MGLDTFLGVAAAGLGPVLTTRVGGDISSVASTIRTIAETNPYVFKPFNIPGVDETRVVSTLRYPQRNAYIWEKWVGCAVKIRTWR